MHGGGANEWKRIGQNKTAMNGLNPMFVKGNLSKSPLMCYNYRFAVLSRFLSGLRVCSAQPAAPPLGCPLQVCGLVIGKEWLRITLTRRRFDVDYHAPDA